VKRYFLIFIFFGVLSGAFGQEKRAYELPVQVSQSDYSDKIIIVRFREGSLANSKSSSQGRSATGRTMVQAIHGATSSRGSSLRVEAHPLSDIYKVVLREGEDPLAVVNELLQSEEVEYAEPYFNHQPLIIPNDPDASPTGGNQDYLSVVNAYDAWSIERGDTSIVIGILDTGVEMDHPDLADNIAYNLDDPVNGVDDDGDGLVDNFAGWDIANDDNNPSADTNPHGTQVTGTSSASTNNGTGMAGTGYLSRFLPFKIYTSGTNSFRGGYEAIALAADLGCKVINLSWGSPGSFSQFGQDIINYAVLEKDAVVVAAAGNTNQLLDFYPASFDNVLSVGSTLLDDQKAPWATYSYNIDLMAPGNNLYTTNNGNSFTNSSGTSLSSPMVAGLAALIRARFPGLTAQQVMERIRVNTDDIYTIGSNSSYTGQLGRGRMNMLKALTDNSSPSIRIQSFDYDNGNGPYAFYGDTLTITMNFKNFLYPSIDAEVRLSSSSPYVTVIQPSAQLGPMATFGEKNNASEAFKILLSDDLPINETIYLRVEFSDGSYEDFQYISIQSSPDHVNFDNGKLTMTLDSDGDLGYKEDFFSTGVGFRRYDNRLLGNIGLVTALDKDTVMDNAPFNLTLNTRDSDFQPVQNVKFHNNSIAHHDARLTFDDSPGGSKAPGLLIEQKTLAWDKNDFIIQEYRITNTGSRDLSDLHVALFADWDLNDKNFNRAHWHDALKLGYALDARSDTLYTGIALLTDQQPLYFAVNNKNFNGNATDIPIAVTDSVKYSLVSQGIGKQTAGTINDGNDISQMMGGTIADLGVYESEKVALVLVSGNSLSDLINAVSEAQTKYNEYRAAPPLLEVFNTCPGDPATVNPTSGNTFSFYSDADLTNHVHTGNEFTTPPVSDELVYFAVNKDELYEGDVRRIIVKTKPVNADFSMNPNPLLLDETGQTSVQFTDQSIDAVSWQWTFSHGFNADVQHPLISYTQKGSYSVEVTVENDIGCIETINRPVEVDNRSNLPDLSDQTICRGERINLDPANATNIEVYSDSNEENLIFSGTEFISGEILSDTTFYIISTDSTYSSNTKAVQVYVSPVNADFIHQPDTVDLSSPHIITLKNQSAHHELFYWLINGEVLTVNTDATYTYDVNTPFEVKLVVEDISGCRDSVIQQITPTTSAVIDSQAKVCLGGTAAFSVTEGSYLNFYADAAGNELIGKGSGFTLDQIKNDTIIFYTNNSAYGESEVGSFTVEVSKLKAEFGVSPEEVNLADGHLLPVNNSSVGAISYQWFVNNDSVSTEENPVLEFNENGEYTVQLTVQDEIGCQKSASQPLRVVTITSLSEQQQSALIYPNPTTDRLFIELQYQTEIRLYDLRGTKMPVIRSGNSIDLASFDPGVYILEFNLSQELIRKKIIKK